jgi:predicted amidohydrolase
MSKTIQIAAIQMDAAPAPTPEKLAQAERLIVRAMAPVSTQQYVQHGAQLVVLPEVFNTGYEYSDGNYLRAESFDDLTATWMRKTAADYHIHLAGTFLRKDQNDIYNTLLLVSPDGRQWHYDKNYPWIWERAYFRKGTGITIADTGLGKIGFQICWDVAHPDLWQQYAGKVDLMLVSSCPPKALDLALVFPDGKRIMSKSAGALIPYLKRTSDETFGQYLRRQASFLGVPVVQATSTGTFTSSIPNPKRSLALIALLYPPLWKYRSCFEQARFEAGYFNETYIADASGVVLQRVQPEVEGYALSPVTLSDVHPQPKGKQPPFGISKFAYLFDTIANKLLASEYYKKTRKYLGQ